MMHKQKGREPQNYKYSGSWSRRDSHCYSNNFQRRRIS